VSYKVLEKVSADGARDHNFDRNKLVVAEIHTWFILRTMRLDRLLIFLATAAMVAVTAAGCGGFSGTRSVSPASFFMPGLLQNAPTVPCPIEAMTNSASSSILAQVR
ncbi:MAG: hypothetical protein NTW03_10695, partial [Verrucomicrobia bacterium]|nr:hypothetical protein [Verrucomicrobiota bacterium]